MTRRNYAPLAAAAAGLWAASAPVHADPVVFNPDATAVFSQPCCGGGGPDEMVNGSFADGTGWANAGNLGNPNTAVMELSAPTPAAPATDLSFQIISGGYGHHTIGSFRVSVTQDANATYGDGLNDGGDVAANWVEVPLTVVSSLGGGSAAGPFNQTGPTLTPQGDNRVLASGANPEYAKYALAGQVPFGGITGIRLETIPDPSLPAGASGRGDNGNYVIVEFAADATPVPEPAALSLLGLGGLMALGRRRR